MDPAQRPQWASRTRAPAIATDVAAEKAISAAASRAWWRTRRTGPASATGVMLMLLGSPRQRAPCERSEPLRGVVGFS